MPDTSSQFSDRILDSLRTCRVFLMMLSHAKSYVHTDNRVLLLVCSDQDANPAGDGKSSLAAPSVLRPVRRASLEKRRRRLDFSSLKVGVHSPNKHFRHRLCTSYAEHHFSLCLHCEHVHKAGHSNYLSHLTAVVAIVVVILNRRDRFCLASYLLLCVYEAGHGSQGGENADFLF